VLQYYLMKKAAKYSQNSPASPKAGRKLFCEMNPLFYQISTQKEILKRHLKDWLSGETFTSGKQTEPLLHLISRQSSHMIKRSPGINLEHQYGKAVNIRLSAGQIHGTLIRPGEVFSFWKTIGKLSKKKGYREGRIINRKTLVTGLGGGLCNLANTLHLLVLHSPMEVVEFHGHSDALAPDEGPRRPFSSGTSVSYNHVDYRFRNNSDQTVQLMSWCEGETLHAELRSEFPVPYTYDIQEEDHHFTRIEGKYYRLSKIYQLVRQRSNQKIMEKNLVRDNRSEVMYDERLIPEDQIRQSSH
jgi:vancomycin resistance protein VanW